MKNIEVLDGNAAIHDLVVVAFDMCSSSKIIEDLSRTDNLKQYDRLMKNLHLWLWSNAVSSSYIVYKFTGDGWLVLFPSDKVTGQGLMKFVSRLASKFQSMRKQFVDNHLESIPQSIGLTFGVEMGPIRKVVLGTEVEFIGRALNVACRLQAAVKDKGSAPDYRCLFSRKVYNRFLTEIDSHHFGPAVRTLRNISGGEKYRCLKVDFSNDM